MTFVCKMENLGILYGLRVKRQVNKAFNIFQFSQ